MLKIRLQRIGRRNKSAFRIVVAEHTLGPKSGNFTERLGSYDPHSDAIVLDKERASYWISVGAQPTEVVYNIFVKEGVIEGKPKNVLPKKSPIISEEQEADSESEDSQNSENAEAENVADSEGTKEDSAQEPEKTQDESESADENKDGE